VRDNRYKIKGTYSKYSSNGKPLELSKSNDKYYSYVLGYNNQYVIAQVENAAQNQIFHTSFESDGTPGTSRSGRKYKNSGSYTIPFTPPADGMTYVMSYWYWSSNQWIFSDEIPFNQTINIGSRLDDIRVYPLGSAMTTYAYDPGVGITSVTDSNNKFTTYEYDGSGRLKLIKDNNGNIVKSFVYHYRAN